MPQRNDVVDAHVVVLRIQRTRDIIFRYVNRVEIPPPKRSWLRYVRHVQLTHLRTTDHVRGDSDSVR